MDFTESQLLSALSTFIWPFMRINAMFLAMPIFSLRILSAKIKVITSFLITLIMMPLLPAMPNIPPFSYSGFLVTIQQIAIGISMGFILQMVFSVMLVAGQSVAYSMGLGFASMVDPATGVQVPVISQIFIISASLLFLGINGHLLLIEILAESFHSLPIAIIGLNSTDLWQIIVWSSHMFTGGLLLALPIMVSLLFVNISFGVAARAAPQLQIFSIGIPITIVLGMGLIGLSLNTLIENFSMILVDGFALIKQIVRL